MDLLLKIHRNSNEIEFEKIWKEGIFVFDSNVLLDLYRLPDSAKNDLLSVLQNENFKDRIWIGFQVILEYLNNRLSVIGDQKNMFNKVRTSTSNVIDKINILNEEYKREIDGLKLTQRHALINPDEYVSNSHIKEVTKVYHNFLESLTELEQKQADVNDKDEIRELVFKIFKDKIGTSFSKEYLTTLYKDGAERYAEKIPPGYMDTKKEGAYFIEDKKYTRKYGDLILWKEIINHAKSNSLKYVVLVTGDVKEDWWEEMRGRKTGPRKELLNEIYSECENLEVFHLYNTSSFLQYAKKEIDENIKESSINETWELIGDHKRIETLGEIPIEKKGYLNQLFEINKEVSNTHSKLEKAKLALNKLKEYRNELYDNSQPLDDIRELAHNLAYTEAEYEEEINDLQDKMNIDLTIQKELLSKLRAVN